LPILGWGKNPWSLSLHGNACRLPADPSGPWKPMANAPLDETNFANVRTRMQRYADAKCFNAWVVSLDETAVVVEVSALQGLDMGETFLFQVSGLDSCATFQADLKRMEGPNLRFQIVTPIQMRPPYEDARVRQNVEGTVRSGDDAFKVCIEDVSAGGMGLLSEEPLDRWKAVVVLAKTAFGGACVDGQVRYCKHVQVGAWRYRIGLAVPDMRASLPLFGVRIPKPRAA